MKYTFAIIAIASFVAGCIISDDFIGEANQFSCETDQDCLGTFECRDQVCQPRMPDTMECPDSDGDGYGVGQEVVNCPLCQMFPDTGCEQDPDDGNALIFPGAPDVCDDVDNDGDGSTDNLTTTCASVNDCLRNIPNDGIGITLPEGTRVVCENQLCVVKMRNSLCAPGVDPCPCNSDPLPCNGGAYDAVPAECQ